MATQEQVELALQNMHNWMASVMASLKEIEDDRRLPGEHKIKLMAHRWDWENIQGRCDKHKAKREQAESARTK